MKELEKQLKAVANRRRLAILKYLKQNRGATVSDIAGHIKLSFRSTSKHLGILAANDIVDREQSSLHMVYRLSQSQRQAVHHILSLL